jgi:hypothetical protein
MQAISPEKFESLDQENLEARRVVRPNTNTARMAIEADNTRDISPH